jgi:hypothetical protein
VTAQVVRTAEHKRTRQKYAVKFIDKSRSEQTGFADTIQVQRSIRGPWGSVCMGLRSGSAVLQRSCRRRCRSPRLRIVFVCLFVRAAAATLAPPICTYAAEMVPKRY